MRRVCAWCVGSKFGVMSFPLAQDVEVRATLIIFSYQFWSLKTVELVFLRSLCSVMKVLNKQQQLYIP